MILNYIDMYITGFRNFAILSGKWNHHAKTFQDLKISGRRLVNSKNVILQK